MTALRYLLDTNILSDMLRHPGGLVRRRLALVGPRTVCTSVIVACEMQYGVMKRGASVLQRRLVELLEEISVLSFGDDVYRHYARIRVELESAGNPIGPNDLFIAAHAMGLSLTLVTNNTREFGRIEGLTIEDWLV